MFPYSNIQASYTFIIVGLTAEKLGLIPSGTLQFNQKAIPILFLPLKIVLAPHQLSMHYEDIFNLVLVCHESNSSSLRPKSSLHYS